MASSKTVSSSLKYTSNPDLQTLSLPFDWKGTPVDYRGRFVNYEFPFVNSIRQLLKWQTMRNPQKAEKKSDRWALEIISTGDFLTSGEDCLVWLGHASYFIRLGGVSMLIDPVLYNISLLKRNSLLPVPADTIKGLDYILVSHDHRDHCDEKSLRTVSRNNPNATYLTGLGLGKVLRTLTGSNNIQEAGWYQQYKTDEKLKIYYVPSRHWGRRLFKDTNARLWGGYVIQGRGKTIYFGGDSGYGGHFADIGKVFPGIDYFLAGIGAYKPEFFMSQSHMSPADALKAFGDTGAKTMIPMHYGTFDLSDEPLGDPERVLKKLQGEYQGKGKIQFLKPGEAVDLSK